MVRRFSFLKYCALAAVLAGCAGTGSPTGPAGSGPEAELARQAQAMQRTVLEATVTGAVLGGAGTALFGGDRDDVLRGTLFGAAAGAAAGSYVGYLQRQYAGNEDRLERLRADIERTNAETAAAVRNMRVVLEQNRWQLAAARAGDPEGLPAAEAAAERDLGNMRLVVAGAERRRDEFMSTRSLQLVEGQATGVDAQIEDLSRRIAEMRSITDTLAEEI
jgi:hypothetical protein